MNRERSEQPAAQTWHELDRDGTHLVCADFGGSGTPVILLHGLAGHATEWTETASWLRGEHRVLAPDLRGHGGSERHPADVSRDAQVEDVVAWVKYLGLGAVVLVGQSLGGHTAFLVAARHPELVDKLVVVEASPGERAVSAVDIENEAVGDVRRWLESWPVPFPSREAAITFFGRNDNWARAWAEGLEERKDGLYPSFDIDVMVETLKAAGGSYWDEWRSIKCPVLLVLAKGRENRALAHGMIEDQANASLVEIPAAGHDLHLDNPAAWRTTLERFLDGETVEAPPLNVRSEERSDAKAIAEVTEAAFGKAREARMVDAIRCSDGYVPELSVVAERDGVVIGHAMLSYVTLAENGRRLLELGPISVRPDQQGRGVGSALVEKLIAEADARGEQLVLVLGHPAYYPRFGFRLASSMNLRPKDERIPDAAFMAIPLRQYEERIKGTIVFPDAYSVE